MVRISSDTYEYVREIETELFPEPDPFANFDATDAYNSGTYTEPAYQAPSYSPPQQYGQRIDDGLGHYSDDGGATWMNYSGGAYQEPAPAFDMGSDPYFGNFDAGAAENLGADYNPQQDYEFGNFDAGAAENLGSYDLPTSPTRAEFVDYDLGNMNQFADPGFESPWNPPWMREENPAEAVFDNWNIRQPDPYEPGYVEDSRFDTSGGMLGNPIMGALNVLEAIDAPFRETGTQFLSPWKGGIEALPGMGGDVGDIFNGWQDLAGSIREADNPLDFARIQTEKQHERPWYEQLGGEIFAPSNLIGTGALKKVGLLDEAIDFGGTAIRGLRGVDDAVETVPSIYKSGILPRLGEEAQFPPGLVDVPAGRAMPQFAGAADETLAFGDESARVPGEVFTGVDGVKYVRTETGILPANTPHGRAYIANLNEQGIIPAVADDTALNEPRRALLDALDAQVKFRESGEADNLIHQGRVKQAKGIDAATNDILGSGAGLSEAAQRMGAGAKVGKLLPPGSPLNLDEATQQGLIREIVEYTGNRSFDRMDAIRALDNVNKGEYVQPKQLKALRAMFGNEIADAIAKTNSNRLQTVAELTDEDLRIIERQAKVDGVKIATLERQAVRQHQLADEITQKARMDPTNKRLKSAAENARARAISAENQADRLLVDKAERYNVKQAEKAARAAKAENAAEVDAALRRDKGIETAEQAAKRQADDEWAALLDTPRPDAYDVRMGKIESRDTARLAAAQDAAKAAGRDKADTAWARSLDDAGPDEYALRQQRIADADQRKLGRQQDRAKVVQTDRRATQEWRESGQAAIAAAEKEIDKSDVSPALKTQLKATVETWVRGNAAILDGMGSEGPNVLRQIYAATVGEVSDSWTSKLLTERAFLQNALEQSGMSPDGAKDVAKLLQEAEIKRRFGGTIPKHVQDSLDQAKGATRGADGKIIRDAKGNVETGVGGKLAEAGGDISQTLKNTTLGIGDLAVFGQQGAKLTLTNAPQIIAGGINRLLNLAHLGVDTGFQTNNLPRRVQKALDGVSLSSAGITDLSQEGTIIGAIPKVGKTLDKPIVKATKFLTDLQFKHVLGSMRDLAFEGNLVLAKATGADVTSPVVRQRAADWANASSGAAKLAQRSTRREVEKGTMLSPGLTRAQIQQMGQVARGLTSGSRVDRVLAATTIASTGMVTLAIGKLLNDHIGLGEFEFDPSKPGFGDITLPGGTTMNVFAQEQILKTVARSFRQLAEDGVTESDWKPILTEWGKLGIGRSSPAMRLGAAAFGTGYQPGEGYRFGDYSVGIKDQALSTFTPPIAQNIIREGFDPVRTPLEAIGVNAYPENIYAALERANAGKPFFGPETTDEQRDKILRDNPKLAKGLDDWRADRLKTAQEQRDPEADRTIGFEELRKVDVTRLEREKEAAEVFADNRNIEEFRRRLDKIQMVAAIDRARIDTDFKLFQDGKPPSDPMKLALYQYYDVYDKNMIAGVDIDFEQVDREHAALEKEWAAADIAAGRPPGTTKAFVRAESSDTVHDPVAQRVYDAKDQVRELGYWDINEKVFTVWAAQTGAPVTPGQSSDEFFDSIEDRVYAKIRPTAKSDTEAIKLSEQAMKTIMKDYNDLVSDARKAVREGDPAVMRALISAGYYDPGKEVLGTVVEKGVLAE